MYLVTTELFTKLFNQFDQSDEFVLRVIAIGIVIITTDITMFDADFKYSKAKCPNKHTRYLQQDAFSAQLLRRDQASDTLSFESDKTLITRANNRASVLLGHFSRSQFPVIQTPGKKIAHVTLTSPHARNAFPLATGSRCGNFYRLMKSRCSRKRHLGRALM